MKKLIPFSCLLIIPSSLLAQAGKVAVKPVPKVINPQPILKTLNDSASYAIGLSIAGFCKQQGITKPNNVLVSRSINDVLGNKPALISDAVSDDIINKLLAEGKIKTGPVNPASSKAILKNANDSASYAIGLNHANFFKQQGITKLNTAIITRAVNDVLGNKPLINDRMANNIMNKLIMRIQEDKIRPAIELGNAFLENNKKRPEVKTTASGLQYEVVVMGTGQKPAATDSVTCNYKGTFINGVEFDNSYKRGMPITFALNGVIPGWTEGLQLMTVGSKYKFYVPYTLGYGAFDYNGIPGGSALLFEVELLDVKKGGK